MRHTHLKRIGLLVLAAVMGLMSLIASPARAEFAAVGPVSAPHGFPLYYTDSNGLSLELCLDADWCFFDPVDPNDPNQAALGIGGEVFWWMAEAEADPLVANGRTLLVMALEGTFGGDETVVNGQQISFGRLRIRVDVPAPGTYVVTHPFGTLTFENVTVEDGINYTADIGAANFLDVENGFLGALQSTIGPFLTWPDYQNDPTLKRTTATGEVIQYVGDNATPHVVVGSPTGNNFFRVADANGNTLTQTDLFVVMGRVYDGKAALPHTYPDPPAQVLNEVGPINRLTDFGNDGTVSATFITDGTTAGYALGYPVWYRDQASLQLTICPGGDPLCISDPINPADPLQVALGTGGETFWWSGDAAIDEDSPADDPTFVGTLPAPGVDEDGDDVPFDALLVLGLEGTFGGAEALIDGQQISFGRTRIRIDAPFAGTYRVIYPYGEQTFTVPAPGKRAINFTADIGIADPADPDSAFAGALFSEIGPNFLTWPNYLDEPTLQRPHLDANGNDTGLVVQYVGDPAVPHVVTGSMISDETGQPVNYFRVIGTDPVNPSNNFDVRTSQFAVSGKVYDPATFRVGLVGQENIAPVIDAPAPITITVPASSIPVPATEATIAAFLAAATAGDAQDGDLTASITHDAPTAFPLGITTVTFSVIDSGGLTGTATSTVTIRATENTPPVVIAPQPIIVTAPAGATSVPATEPAIAAFLAGASASDIEDGTLTPTNDAPASFPLGTTIVTFSAIDSGGLTGTATATVTVNATPVAAALSIQQFKAANQVRLARGESVDFSVRIRNNDRTVAGTTSATLVGTQNGAQVYNQTIAEQTIPARVNNATFAFPSFTPTVTGDITWTLTIVGDTATATTRVR